jgi:hypothetical protein
MNPGVHRDPSVDHDGQTDIADPVATARTDVNSAMDWAPSQGRVKVVELGL